VLAGCASAATPAGPAWPGDDDGWAGESLTALEIAELAAADCAGEQPAEGEGWDQDADLDPGYGPVGQQPVDVDAWLAALPRDLRDPDLDGAPAPAAPEVLPGLMPRRLGTGGGFDAGGVADRVPPGPVLAGLAADKWDAGLAKASDDELAGLMIAWRRLASWAAAGELATVAELDRRRDAQVAAGADPHLAEHVADEVAMVLTLTSWSAGALVDRAVGLAALPKTRQALAAGLIDVPKALVILGEVTGLSRPHAARVEAAVLGRAPGQTTGELRRAVRRAVLAVDPDAAQTRKQRALKDARVERWDEGNGTAALAGRDLPPAGVLAADAYLTAWAHRLKAAGLDGTMDQLRARAYLALLGGQPPQSLLSTPAGTASEPARDAGPLTGMSPGSGSPTETPPSSGAPTGMPANPGVPAGMPPSSGVPTGTPANSGPFPGINGRLNPGGVPGAVNPSAIPGNDHPGGIPRNITPGAFPRIINPGAVPGNINPGAVPRNINPGAVPGNINPGAVPRNINPGAVPRNINPGAVPRNINPGAVPGNINPGAICGSVNVTLPLATWLGWSSAPGEVAGFGPLDAQESRALATALARTAATRWCLTITDTAGRAVAHGCAKPGADRPPLREGPGPPPREGPGPPRGGPGSHSPECPGFPAGLGSWLAKFKLAWLEPGECSHRHESPGYRPSASLAHLVQIRQQTCTAPGCRRPATECDAEHTVPYGKGGRTCLCNLGPCCRRHHRAKQAAGWQLEQPRPGVFRWATPLGRAYTTGPAEYSVG
jgi:hypothetical protein